MLEPQARNAVSGQIATLDKSISQLEAVESRLSGELNELRTRMELLRNQRAALESRIAAVWSLPNELLAYIFELGVRSEEARIAAEDDEDDEDDEEGREEQPAFNILVSHVCRTFREVAIHTSTLWSQIHILDLDPRRLDFVRACVQRSGSSGLDIFINCDDSYLGVDSNPIRSLMDILVPHINRFKRLTVRLCGFQYLYLVMQHLNKPAPQLESLELSDLDDENDFDEDDAFSPPSLREPLTLFGGVMPKLEGISLEGAHVAWAKCNFTGLASLHLGYHTRDVRPTYEEFRAIIDASPTLQTLDLRGSAPLISSDISESSLYPPLQMERLEDLHISEIRSDYATALIPLLNTPNLQSLSLTDLITNDDSAFFHRIIGPPALFPTLTALKLAYVEMHESTFEDLLRASSKLTHLALYFSTRILPSWLAYLGPRGPENEILCPKLECLRCVHASLYDLKDLVKTRRDAGFPLPTLQIDKESEGWDEKLMEWLRDNTTVELIEPSDIGTDDEMDSDWATEEDEDEIELGGLPYFTMEGFSDDEDEDEDEDDGEYEDASEMDIDESDDSDIDEE